MSKLRKFLQRFSTAAFVFVFVSLLMGLGFLFSLSSGLPAVSQLKTYQHSHATEVFSDDGKKIGEFTTERRYPVDFEKIPAHVLQAFISAEDAHFYEHQGIDLNSIARAFWLNLLKGRYAQGGSTITQQVARALLLESKKKVITRKLREMILAYRMEKELSKQEILSLYLSEIYLGHGSYGIGAAARNYFRKKVEDLSVAEASLLAGLPQRPNDWNPFHHPDLAKKRQSYVLRRMVDEKYLSPDEGKTAFDQPLKLYPLDDLNNTEAPYFVEYVRQYLMDKYGSETVLTKGFKVHTTVNYEFQKAAEKAVEKGLRDVEKRLGWRGAKLHLASIPEQDEWATKSHQSVLEQLKPVRILPADAAEKKLKVLEFSSSELFGDTPLKVGGYYDALVVGLDSLGKTAEIRMGLTKGLIDFDSASWVKIENKPVDSFTDFLKVGDVVSVRVVSIESEKKVARCALEQEPEVSGALLSYEVQSGFVKAMVGGPDFNISKFNCALQAKRQVGSTFKPLIYAAAFDKGFSPSSLVTDSPVVFRNDAQEEVDTSQLASEDWKPHNYGGKFAGEISLREALIRSMNVPTVKLLSEISLDYGIEYARSLGITSPLPRDLTIGLGSWSASLEEIMRAYAIFPRLGKPVQLTYIKKVEDLNGSVLEEVNAEEQESQIEKVISEQTAYVMTDLLKGVIREGTGRAASGVPGQVAGKTGTSNDYRDAWFVGYSPHMVSGVWVGYLKDKVLGQSEVGGRAAAPIWTDYMKTVGARYPRRDFQIPEDIVFAYVDRETGRPASPGNPNRVRVAFKQGLVPNRLGNNLPRVGEPHSRATSATDLTVPQSSTVTEPSPPAASDELPEEENTQGFQREGYE